MAVLACPFHSQRYAPDESSESQACHTSQLETVLNGRGLAAASWQGA